MKFTSVKRDLTSENAPFVSTTSYFKRLIREYVWKLGKIDYKSLYDWIEKEPIDIVFFVGGDSVFAYNLVKRIIARYNHPLVLFITDDYLLKRSKASLPYEIRRRMLFKAVKRLMPKVRLFITISKKMSLIYGTLLKKSSIYYANMPEVDGFGKMEEKVVGGDTIITYAGGLHYNRWKTLSALGKAIQQYNAENRRTVRLNIYSQTRPEGVIMDSICIPGASSYLGSLSSEQVKTVLVNSDVLVHVESFEQEDIEATRLSFSTKIYEYMATGKAVLAIGPDAVASIDYLKDCSFYAGKQEDITKDLIALVANESERQEISKKVTCKYNELKSGENSKAQIIKAILGVM